jgi:hypothetical protein
MDIDAALQSKALPKVLFIQLEQTQGKQSRSTEKASESKSLIWQNKAETG